MMLSQRRVKIVATIGPATNSREKLREAILRGMNVARLNMSHGTHEDHLKVINHIRDLSNEFDAPVSILMDLQGPKIRVGRFFNGAVELANGSFVTVTPENILGTHLLIPTDFHELAQVVKPGGRISLDDGLIELRVESVVGDKVRCEVVFGGILKDRKGMNIPGADLPVESLTDKDLIDLDFGIKNKVDYVALSFVRRAKDTLQLRSLIEQKQTDIRSDIRVVSKIEMLQAVESLSEIVSVSDAIMVARGDLAVEVGHSVLPGIQKEIIRLCNKLGRPVITATQMLDSMVEHPKPTRAEVTDIANSVLDGTDAVMLSAETASGKFPFECISTMHEVIMEVERTRPYYSISLEQGNLGVAEAIGASACLTALKINAKAIVCLTTSGKTATYIARYRPKAQLIAMTHVREILNGLELVWGLQTMPLQPYTSSEEAMEQIERQLLHFGLVQKGDLVVVTLGRPVSKRAKTNSLRVLAIEREGIEKLGQDKLPLRCRDNLIKARM